MTEAVIPAAAGEVFEEGVFCHVAARTRHGPHVTPVVFAFRRGRVWLTTARRSVKAGAWARDGSVAGMVRRGDAAVTFRGSVATYDVLDPDTWPAALHSAPRIARAATAFSLKNARFFAGYAVDARRVPLAWTPPGRVFVEIDPAAGRMLRAASGAVDGGQDRTPGLEVAGGWGPWPARGRFLTSYRPRPATVTGLPLDARTPASVRRSLGEAGRGALAVDAGGELSVIPVEWRRVPEDGVYHAVLPRAWAELTGIDGRARVALCADHASAWRAAAMQGVLLQGWAEAFAPGATSSGVRALARALPTDPDGPPMALIRLEPDRVVWWQGWASGTVRA